MSQLTSVTLKMLIDNPDKGAIKYESIDDHAEVWIPRSLIKRKSLVDGPQELYDLWVKTWFCKKNGLTGREVPIDEVMEHKRQLEKLHDSAIN